MCMYVRRYVRTYVHVHTYVFMYVYYIRYLHIIVIIASFKGTVYQWNVLPLMVMGSSVAEMKGIT